MLPRSLEPTRNWVMVSLAVTSTEVSVEVEAPTSASGPSTPSKPGEEQAYIVQPGDSLSVVAQQFCGEGQLWRLVFEGTNERAAGDPTFHAIENPDLIRLGWRLWMPAQ